MDKNKIIKEIIRLKQLPQTLLTKYKIQQLQQQLNKN